MINYIEGQIIVKKDKFIIVKVAGIGYQVFVSAQTGLKLPEIGRDIKLFCFQNVKKDAFDLFCFFTF